MDDLLSEFLTETNESLESLDNELIHLEQYPNDPELLGNIFRLVHTIKGTCGFLGLPRLETVAHSAENVLGNFRDGTQVVTPEAVSLILGALDRIKELIAELEESEHEPEGDDSELIERLDAMYKSAKSGGAAPSSAPQGAGKPAQEEAPVSESEAGSDDKGSVYLRVGGASTLDTAVELLHRKLMADDELAPLFDGVQMARLQGRQVEYLVKITGGPDEFEPEDLIAIHALLVERGAGDEQFQKLSDYLRTSLSELEVRDDLVDIVMETAEPARLGLVPEGAAGLPASQEEHSPAVAPAPAQPAPPADAAREAGSAKESSVAHQSIRVNVDVLENLMTMVSELVLTRNQLLQMVRKYEDTEFKVPLQRLSHVTTDLQEGVMKTRMQPIGNAWAKLPRIIRDLGLELDKKIELEMIGADTGLDRQVLDMIRDPLTHMVRNSGDHGLETPAERKAAGKPETGKVVLNAYHEGGHIVIEIADDGRGINIDRVKAKIISNGLASETELEGMSDQQIMQFIFKPGFSTAEKVTSVSGRGVGMDVVRTNIEKIGGTAELISTEGKGSKFTIRIPLTLAIVSALLVGCRGEKFAIPQLSVVELVRVANGSDHRIERIKDTPVLRLRNRLLPLVSLAQLLKLGQPEALVQAATQNGAEPEAPKNDGRPQEAEHLAAAESGIGRGGGEMFIIVAQVGTYTFGIIVDQVFDTEEIVVKPVAPILRDIPFYSGNTILGDGSVIMILDLNGIATATGEMSVAEQPEAQIDEHLDASEEKKQAFLIFRAGGSESKTVPLSLVARLEEINAAEVEVSNGMPLVQYRGQLMPLLGLESTFTLKETGRQPVVVFTDRDRSMGLVVDEIVDIVEDRLNIELGSERDGILGSAVIGGRATDVIDAGYYVTQAFGDWFSAPSNGSVANSTGARRLLLIDDSDFFRNLITPFLTMAGWQVTSVDCADKALALRDAGENFDVIVSDIEMPGMSGFELALQIRSSGPWQDMPLVALSSYTSDSDLQRGREVGFSDYVAKLDRPALLESLTQTVSNFRGAA